MDIQLRRTKVVSVSGRVSGMQSGTRYSISLVPKDQGSAGGASRGAVVRQEDSTFTLHGVSPGTYWLLLIPAGHVTTKQELVVGESDIEGLTVPVLETSTVKGKIILPASTESRGLRLTLQPTDFEAVNDVCHLHRLRAGRWGRPGCRAGDFAGRCPMPDRARGRADRPPDRR